MQDVDKCVAVLEDLDELPVNYVMLRKNPDIMKTIKQVSWSVSLVASDERSRTRFTQGAELKTGFVHVGGGGKLEKVGGNRKTFSSH